MALISSSIPSFVNGVSQQPYTLRLTSQGEVQENGLSTVSQGLKKRPPTKHLKKIQGTPLANCFIHTINRDTSERYIVVVTNGDLKVYDVNGTEQTVAFPDGKTYLGTATPSTSFSAVTVADYTFLVNKTKVVAANSSTTPERNNEALVNVKVGNYGKTYEILINGTSVASYTTPDGSVAAHSAAISTDNIATELMNDLVAGGYNTAPWSSTRFGSVIRIRNSSTDFTIRCNDGFNNGAMVAIKDELQKFSDLPANAAFNGFTVKITGTGGGETQNSPFNSYYVKFSTNSGNDGDQGTWRECPAPGISLGFTNVNMPHLLVRESNGTFTFKRATWADRIVGDLDSNPQPSFVGRTINDVFFYKNRLGLLSDEAVIFSEAGEYFNFLRTTVTDLLDSDPIDVNASHTKVSILKHAVPYNKILVLFADQTQFVVEDNDILSPKTISIKVATEFPSNTGVKPLAVGKNVYMVVDKGNYSSILEFFADNNNFSYDAQEVTGHVPEYIPSGIYRLASSPNENIMVAATSNDASSLYVYKYFWNGQEKLQSSWSKWNFGSDSTILNVSFIESEMFLVVNRSDGAYFEKVSLAIGNIESGEPYQVYLDRKVQLGSASLSYSSGYTTINLTDLGYSPSVGAYQVVIKTHPSLKAGEILDVEWTGTQARVAGNISGATIAIGRKYLFKYTLSPITIKVPTPGGGSQSDTEGRLQVRKLALNYSDSGYFAVKVTPVGRDVNTYIFSGKVLGSSSSTIGRYSIASGRFSVPVVAQNTGVTISLENDSALPSEFLNADWEGFYTKRSARS